MIEDFEKPYLRESFERAEVDEQGLLFPVYLYDAHTSKIVVPMAPRAFIIGKELFQQVKPSLENNCKAVRCCFAMFPQGTLAFTAFFVSPHILATAAHVTVREDTLGGDPLGFVMSNICSYIPPLRYDEDSHPLTLLHSWKEPGMEEIVEKDPQCFQQLTPCDFAFFRVGNNYASAHWLTPCTQLPEVSNSIFTCQFNSPLPSLSAYENIPNFPKNLEAVNSAVYPHMCSVSVGNLKAYNETQISINTSQVNGSSGAPCFGINQVNQFCGIYIGSIKDQGKFLPNVDNHALHVDHPHFVSAFCRVVLPDLQNYLSNELKAYLSKHHH